ncbi:MAG: molybdopterin synthase catalytic subunit MoaE [Pseudohongiellaceae bacterium]|nr:molybdopterin synthase catalytic subunit MoaE [Pseudohongiellaceae bacterium]
MITVTTEDFDVAQLYQRLRSDADNAGAIATFTGLVREFYEPPKDSDEPRVLSLTLEHYPGMTEKALESIVNDAKERWDVLAAEVVHRVGELKASDQIVFVGVASTHRGDAFAAAEFIMDFLKSRAPFWKKQNTSAGEYWVEAREQDEEALSRWR